MRRFVIAAGRAQAVWRGHPWAYADSVREVETGVAGDEALLVDEEGRVLGRALVSDRSAIRLRLLDRGEPGETVEEVLRSRLRRAVDLRRRLFPSPRRTDAYRLVHAEGDGIPGLVVDRYGPVLVAQFATAPLHRRRAWLARALLEESGAASLLARAGGHEAEEGIAPEDVAFAAGAPVPDVAAVCEEGMRLEVDPRRGQKTGHYTDQRENRLHVAALAAASCVLDLYAGSGGFSIQALRRGAREAVAVETSPRAVACAERNALLNGVASGLRAVREDVRRFLVAAKARGQTWDLVVLDPPNLHPRAGGGGRARRAYRDLNVQALLRVRPGGYLATFTCSAHLGPAAFRDLVVSAARECRRPLRVLREMTAGPDHPVLAAAGEGRYLTGLLLGVEAAAALA